MKSNGKALLLFLLLPTIPSVLGSLNYYSNLHILTPGWLNLWTQHTLFYVTFFYAPMLALLCSYTWRLEHSHNNWNRLLTMPMKPMSILFAKYVFVVTWLLFIQIFQFILFLFSGKLLGITAPFPLTIFMYCIRGTLCSLGILSIQFTLSMFIRNFGLPILIGALGSLLGFLLAVKDKAFYCPYSLVLLGMNSSHGEDLLSQPGNLALFTLISLLFITLPHLFSYYYVHHMDIKSSPC